MTRSGARKNLGVIAVGVVIVLFGLLFMFQGLGVVKGSAMTDSNFWAVAGPVIAIAGTALVVRGSRPRGGSASPTGPP